MKRKSMPLALCLATLLSLTIAVPARAAVISTAAEWSAAVAAANGGTAFVPLKTQGVLPDGDQFAWAGYQWIEAYIALAQSTGDAAYMEKGKQMIDYMLTKRDDVRFAAVTMTPIYWSAPTYYLFHSPEPAMGWRRTIASSAGYGQVSPLIDGRICEAIILWCEMARRGFPQYESSIATYLPKVKQTLDMHKPIILDIPANQNITGRIYNPVLQAKSFKYWWEKIAPNMAPPPSDAPKTWSNFMAINHNCTFARAMMGYDNLTGGTGYHAAVQGIINFFLNSLDTAQPTKAVWMYSPLDLSLGAMEDVGHAAVALSLIEEAYRVGGYGVDQTIVNRLIASFNTFYDSASKRVRYYIDGTGAIEAATTTRVRSIGWKPWLWLSRFDPTIATRVRATYNTYYTSTMNSPEIWAGWANLVYWESYLNGTAAFDDSSVVQTPRELYNDSVNRLLFPYCIQTTSNTASGGAPEGTTFLRMTYNIFTTGLLTSVVYTFSPAENTTGFGGIRLNYRTTGTATSYSLVLMDGTFSMTATPGPSQLCLPHPALDHQLHQPKRRQQSRPDQTSLHRHRHRGRGRNGGF